MPSNFPVFHDFPDCLKFQGCKENIESSFWGPETGLLKLRFGQSGRVDLEINLERSENIKIVPKTAKQK